MGVCKYIGTEMTGQLLAAGCHQLGENRPQQLWEKAGQLEGRGVEWHMIGHLQRNKVRQTLEHCCSIHSLNSLRLLQEIEKRLEALELPLPDIFVEVNCSGEASKTGLPAGELADLLAEIPIYPNVAGKLQGLMTIPPYCDEPDGSRPFFRELRQLRDQYLAAGLLPPGSGLSMGMSSDFETAVEEGATVVRIGSAIYRQD